MSERVKIQFSNWFRITLVSCWALFFLLAGILGYFNCRDGPQKSGFLQISQDNTDLGDSIQ
jgi:hypothetical protein